MNEAKSIEVGAPQGKQTGHKRPLWARVLKWLGLTVGVLVALVLVLCSLVVWILTPQKLTPLVADVASGYLDAKVEVARVELTFWHTFPKFTVDVDSLTIVSEALRHLPDSVLTDAGIADADSLLSLRAFSGGVNLAKLFAGEVALYDVEFRSPRVNLVQVNDSVANYLIFPEAEKADTVASSSVIPFHKFSVNSFTVSDAGPLRFRSLADSTDVALSLGNVSFKGVDRPVYTMAISGNVTTPMLDAFAFEELSFGASGSLTWDSKYPCQVAIDGLKVGVDEFELTASAQIDFNDGIKVDGLEIESNLWQVSKVCAHLPAAVRPYTEPLRTDMAVRLRGALASAWHIGDSVLPSFNANIEIPQCAVEYQTLHFNKFACDLAMAYDAQNPDRSVVELKRLFIDGRMIGVDCRASATNLFSDPLVEGRFKGAVSLNRMPPRLRGLMPAHIAGAVRGDADFRLRLGDLSPEKFHRIYAKGGVIVNDIEVKADTIGEFYVRRAELRFGSNTAFVNDAKQRIDSLLTLSLKADTMSAHSLGIDMEAVGLRAGGGTLNRSRSADTTEINPFGVKLAIERLKLDSPADTMRLRLRDAAVAGSLRRYKGEARLPRMGLKLNIGALHFGQALTRFALREADVDFDLHKRQRHASSLTPVQRAARRKAVADSLRAMTGGGEVEASRGAPLDSAERRLLRQWDFSGHVLAKSGRIVSPSFPLRNRVRNVDFHFNQDSLELHDLVVQAGQSDFIVNGSVTNLRRALVSRRNNTLKVRLSLKSDTINVNEIVRALFAGGSLVQQADSAMVWGDDELVAQSDDKMEQMADTAATGPLLVPRNLDAGFIMRANHILYSDLVLHDFKGALMTYDGAINLRNLSASTDIGSISLDGLYSAPAIDDLRFGLGMKVTRFRLDRLTSIVPAIDSLLPAIKGFAGIVNADVAVTTDLDPNMDIDIPSLRAAVKIEGDSLVLLDADTFKMLSKWLFFKNKKRNLIDHMAVEAVVENSAVELYPFMFDIDRYRLGVMGSNDLAMNLNYHVSVLKSPVPFKFGINIKGTPDKMKIRLGGAKFKENMVVERQEIADNTRVNIVEQIDNVFRRGISKARMGRLTFTPSTHTHSSDNSSQSSADTPYVMPADSTGRTTPVVLPGQLPADFDTEVLSPADSLRFIREGLIDNPDTLRYPPSPPLPSSTHP